MIFLRKAKAEEIAIISDLAEQIWPQTYSDYISEVQLRFMLSKMYNENELLGQLQSGHTFLIATENGKDIGFAGFSIIDTLHQVFKLHKLYILPEAHGKGVGRLLVKEVINLVQNNGAKTIQLNVNRNNKAKDFYLKEGFNIKETVDLDIGNGFFMNDYVMEKTIGL
ncbi:MAG: GNAT family N-acetyltransferase [Bacteroidia bacterium]